MEKDEILRKAQNKNTGDPDEMEIQIVQKGTAIANYCILLISFVLMLVKIFTDHPWYDVYVIMFASMAAQHLYKGFKLKQNHEFVIGVITAVLSVIALVGYIMEIV